MIFSPCLFILVIEASRSFIFNTVGEFISGCKRGGESGGREWRLVSLFFFLIADDPLLFYEIDCDFLLYLGWVLHCFELVSGPYS